MTPSRWRAAREALSAAARLSRGPAIVLVVYLILRTIFVALTEHGGLLSPSGGVSVGVALLGVAVLVLRLSVLFVLPAVVVYRWSKAAVAPHSAASRSSSSEISVGGGSRSTRRTQAERSSKSE